MPSCVIESFCIRKNENVTPKKFFWCRWQCIEEEDILKMSHPATGRRGSSVPLCPNLQSGGSDNRSTDVGWAGKENCRVRQFDNGGIWPTVDINCKLQNVKDVKIWGKSYIVWTSWRAMPIYELSCLGIKAQYYWINVSFTVKKSRWISSPDKEPTAVATSADNRMPMKMMKRNLMKRPLFWWLP